MAVGRSSSSVARALAARCGSLRQTALEAGDDREPGALDGAVERQAFTELLASGDAPRVDLATLYTDFLSAFAPRRRRELGVYYTPDAVVHAQVRLAADLLERRLGCPGAYADERVEVVDPAAGSGAYPLAVVAHADASRPGSGSSLAGRLHLFEPMVGAALIASARLQTALGTTTDGQYIVERDVLAAPVGVAAPIVVCLGNPPYNRQCLPPGSRVSSRKGGWIRFGTAAQHARPILEDFFAPGGGRHAKNLYNDYVYFWRWAVWAALERRSGPGIVSFVTPASYLRGPGFAGMREWLRRAFDELWILDLEGDRLAARGTHNVFPIRTPVAVAMGVRYAAPDHHHPATVHYSRFEGTGSHKLAALASVRRLDDLAWQTADAGWSMPFVAHPHTDYQTWPKLTDLFPLQLSGAQLKRTWPIGPTPAVLRERWQRLLEMPASPSSSSFTVSDARAAALRVSRDRGLDSAPSDLRDPSTRLTPLRALAPDAACIAPVPYAYRSFDRQWVLPDARLGDFMRPALWRIAGPRQVFLTSLLTNVLGPGPAAVATALVPDLDHFRGSFGGRAVIPLWCDLDATRPNIADGWLAWLARRYGSPVSPEQWLAYCYALLATSGYVRRFEDELRTPGPRMPVTRDPALFQRAAALGEQLLRIQTYREGSVPLGTTSCLVEVETAYPTRYRYDPEQQTLQVGSGCFGPLPAAAWAFSVSGMRVIGSWLARRVRRPTHRRSALDAIAPRAWTAGLTRELLELIWVVEATLTLEPELDVVLGEIVSGGCYQLVTGGVLDQKRLNGLGLEWPREVVALPLVAAELLEARPL